MKPQNITSGKFCVRRIASGNGAIGDGITSALNALFCRYATKTEALVVADSMGDDFDVARFDRSDFLSRQQINQGQERDRDMRVFSTARYHDLSTSKGTK